MGIVHAKYDPEANTRLKEIHIDYEECAETKNIPLDAPARVDKITIDGLCRTKNLFAETIVRDVFTAKNFEEVLQKATKARQKLSSMVCFRNIAVHIDVSKGPRASQDGLEVIFFVKEFKRVIGGVSSHIGNNEGSLLIGMKAPNLLGQGERLQAEYSYGSRKTNNFSLSAIKPFLGPRNLVFTTTLYQNLGEFPTSGFKQLDKGVIFDFAFNSLESLKHNLQYDATIREQYVLGKGSSFDVREQSGVTLKSALRHILTVDGRDEPIFPTCGGLASLTTELAGLGGNVGFVKNEVNLQGNWTMFKDVVFQGTFQLGFLRSISNDMKIGMSDMFFLGGPMSIRGFQPRGIGPTADNDALGANCYWSGGLHIFAPLPFARPGPASGSRSTGFSDYFRTHWFLNAGTITNVKGAGDGGENSPSTWQQLRSDIRLSTGIGIAIRLGQMARVEVNYCWPLEYQKEDRLGNGVQFGVGVQFT